MRHARNVGLALVALLVLGFGVRALVRAFDTGVRRPAPWSGAASLVTEPHTTMSIAKFSNGDTLDNCADVTFGQRSEIDAKRLEARGFSILQSTCAKTFPNAVALASCTRSDLDSDAQPPTHAVGYYYDPATLEDDDTYSGQCLGNGGTWVAKPKDDPQLVRALARSHPTKPHHEFDSLMELLP